MMKEKVQTLISWMALEEWRLHAELFGGKRFAGFPFTIGAFVLLSAGALTYLGVSATTVVSGIVFIAVFLGFQAGTVGFESNDSIENIFGDVTFLIYSTRTQPVSKKNAIAAFVLNDLVYYSTFFLVPMVLGAFGGYHLVTLGLDLGCLQCATGAISIAPFATGLLASPIAFGIGLLVAVAFTFLITKRSWVTGTVENRTNWYEKLKLIVSDGRHSALTRKSVIDVQRSSGGLAKLFISTGFMLGAVWVTVSVVQKWLGVGFIQSYVFGTVLSSTGFSTYNWLTNVDSPEAYDTLPVSPRDLYNSKRSAFILMQFPVGIVYMALASLFLSFDIGTGLVTVYVFMTSSLYVFGITAYHGGFTPSQFMLDTVTYAKFGLSIIIGLAPILVTGFTFTALPFNEQLIHWSMIGYCIGLSIIGVALFEVKKRKSTA